MLLLRIPCIVILSWALKAVSLPHLDPEPPLVNHLSLRGLPVGTCNSDTPCVNGACCGSNNLCGYSPTECGTGCSSNCNAKAEYGQYGTPGQQNCPLNVCCSKFGLVQLLNTHSLVANDFTCSFCRSTSDFYNTGCQNGFGGCGPPPQPSCGGSKGSQRNIG